MQLDVPMAAAEDRVCMHFLLLTFVMYTWFTVPRLTGRSEGVWGAQR